MKKFLLTTAIGIVLTACSSSKAPNQPVEVWKNFEQASLDRSQLSENQSLVVFYRKNDVLGKAVNVYVNGEYHTSLLPSAYSVVSVCAKKNRFTSSFSSINDFGNRTQGIDEMMPVNHVTYLKVIQDLHGNVKLMHVENSVAEQEMAQLPKENQTLSRVQVERCNDIDYGKK